MSKVLIVIDMLNDFAHKDGALFFPGAAEIIPVVKERIEAYMEAGDIIMFLCDAYATNDKEFARFPRHSVKNTWGAGVVGELVVALKGYEIVYLPKTRYSGFYKTELEIELIQRKADEVEVVGVCTSICVMDTVGGLADRDYEITVPLNAIADFDPEASAAAINRMSGLYGAKFV